MKVTKRNYGTGATKSDYAKLTKVLTLCLMIAGVFLCWALWPSVKDRTDLIRREAIDEIAKNSVKQMMDPFLEESLKSELRWVEACERSVRNAQGPNELALAIEDLRRANNKVAETRQEIKANQ